MTKYATMTSAEFGAHRDAIGTQQEVAELMEVDRKTVGRWERGERPVPGPASVLIRYLRRDAESRRARTTAAVEGLLDDQAG